MPFLSSLVTTTSQPSRSAGSRRMDTPPGRRSMRLRRNRQSGSSEWRVSNSSNLPRNVKRAVRRYMPPLGMLFVFLLLAALYESWKVPFTVIFDTDRFLWCEPGSHGDRQGGYNDYLLQIGLLTIIGLAAKNAILIVEYAKVRTDHGMEALQAAVEASKIPPPSDPR